MVTNSEYDVHIVEKRKRGIEKMRKFKKALAFALASAMVISVVPVSAATTNSAKLGKTTLYYNGTKSYKTTKVTATKKAGYTVKFYSSNKAVATVGLTKGLVTARKAGTVTVKANFYKKGKLAGTKSLKLTVKKAPAAVSIKIDKPELMVGETAQMSANKKEYLYFYSADKTVLTVGKTGGKVTAKSGGTTRIAAVNRITGKKKYINVTVLSDAPVATQSGASTITVKNGVSMSDRTITLKRGTTEVKLAEKDGVVFADNGKAATIKTAARLANAEYTVIVKDKAGVEKTSVVKAEAEKVSKIAVLSDKAAVVKGADGQYTKAQVGYKVENQFGEDITKSTSLNVSGTDNPTLDPANHKITFERKNDTYIIGRDIVSVVLVHVETGVTESATLTISNEAAVETLTYEGIYNVDGKTLTDDIDLDSDDFYLLFTAIDQYGVNFKDYKDININKAGSASGSSIDFHVTVAGGITNLKAAESSAFKKITKDGKDYIGAKLVAQNDEDLKAGTASVMAIAANSGKSVTETVTVEAGNKARSLTVSLPSVVAAGEETEFNYVALDAAGNEVTDYDSLKDIEISGGTAGCTLKWEKDAKTGKAKLMFNAENAQNPGKNNKSYASYTFKTVDNKFSTLQVTISETARPVSIAGVDANNKLTPNTQRDIALDDLIIEDQYGRVMDSDALNDAVKADPKAKLVAVRVEAVDGDGIEVIPSVSGTALANKYTKVDVTAEGADTVLFTVKADATDKTASVTTNLALYVGDGEEVAKDEPLSTTNADVEFSKVKEGSIKDVTVEVGNVYAPEDLAQAGNFAKKIVVKAKGAILSADQYAISIDGDNLVPVSGKKQSGVPVHAVQAGKIQKDIFDDDVDGNTVTAKVTVTLNNGEVALVQDVTISKAKPVVATFDLTNEDVFAVSGTSVTVANVVEQVKANIDTFEDNFGTDLSDKISEDFTFVNSYKATAEYGNEFRITYKDLSDGIKVANNGTKNATITGTGTATAEISVGSSNVVATVNITLK